MESNLLNDPKLYEYVNDYFTEYYNANNLDKFYSTGTGFQTYIVDSGIYSSNQILQDYIQQCLNKFDQNISFKDLEVLDLCCGCGNAGFILKRMGFEKIDGVDASANYLENAKSTGIYRNLYQKFIGVNQDVSELEEKYDLIVAIGAFAPNHVPSTGPLEVLGFLNPKSKIKMFFFDINDRSKVKIPNWKENFDKIEKLGFVYNELRKKPLNFNMLDMKKLVKTEEDSLMYKKFEDCVFSFYCLRRK